MGIVKQLVANTLELAGIGVGSNLVPADVADLRGFRPYPVIKIPNNLDHEWQVGFYWYLKRIEGISVLDAGYMAHWGFTKVLGELGLNVTGVDLLQGDIDNVNCVRAFVWDTLMPEASIDTIVANSLFEHLGLDCYGQPQVKSALDSTLLEFHRLLKPKGLLLFQVPYSREPILVNYRSEKFYVPWTRSDLDNNEEYFTTEEESYFARAKGKWIEVSEAVAGNIKQGGGFPSCIVYVKARRKT